VDSSARGGLEPGFRVLFSAIFHAAFLGNFHQGRNLRKWAEAKVWHFVADLPSIPMVVKHCFQRSFGQMSNLACNRFRGRHWYHESLSARIGNVNSKTAPRDEPAVADSPPP
jgi:hypothetical protein